MKTFKDSAGREWSIELTIGTMRALRDAGIDLCNPEQPREGSTIPIAQEIETDLQLFADALWCLLKPQAEKHNCNEASFLEGLNGATLDSAREVFRESLQGFFQSQNFRTAFLKKTTEVLSALSQEIASIDVSEAAKTAGKSSMNSQESSDATPAD